MAPSYVSRGCYYDNTHSKVQNLAGKPLNNVPKAKGDIGGEYDQPLGSLPFGGFVGFDWRYQSKTNFSLSQDPYTIQGGYGIANFSVGINDNHDHYKAQLFVENAFNKPYAVGLNDSNSGFSIPGVAGSGAGTNWTVPRDAFRYFGGRIGVKF